MTQRRLLASALLVAVLALAPARVEAGPRKFVDSVVGLLDQLNTSLSGAGQKLKDGVKEGGIKKGLADFAEGVNGMEAELAPKRAAVWESLKDLPMWIPQAIANTWKSFVKALKKILGPLCPGNGDPQPAPPADPPPQDPPPQDPPPQDPPPGDGEGGDGDKPPADGGEEEQPPADGGGEEEQPPADGGEEEQQPPADGGEEEQKPPADGGEEEQPPADGGGEEEQPPADGGGEEKPPADGGEEKPPADGGEEQAEAPAEEGAPQAPRSSEDAGDEWAHVREGFAGADEKTRFETFGKLGTLIMAEEAKQKRGKDSGALDNRTLEILGEKLDGIRKLHGWMGAQLAETLAEGEGYQALEAQLQVIGPKGSRSVFGGVIREARRRSQVSDDEGSPRSPVSAENLGKIQQWIRGE